MTIVGTSYFLSEWSARMYYRAYGFNHSAVTRKLKSGEISIGLPPLKKGERVTLIDSGMRYAVITP